MVAKTKLENFRKALQKEKKRLEIELRDMQKDSRGIDRMDYVGEGGDNNLADAGSHTFDRERDITLEQNVKDLLHQVERAITKLEKGTYAICEHCGATIPDERLEALPSAELCISCKVKQEKSP